MNAPHSDGGPPPWINPEMQKQINWRDNDIVISVPPKSGTTWTMNIVYQLLSGGDPDFHDIYAEVPWVEFVTRPGMPAEELLTRLERMSPDRPRAFKTHSGAATLGYVVPGDTKNVRYVVVMRNPEEALVSMKPFIEQHSDEWFELWQTPREALVRVDFPSFYTDIVSVMGMHRAIFGFLGEWWPLRNESNVLFLHFNDMKSDLGTALRRIADFIGASPTDAEWSRISEYTTFSWMKEHGYKFDGLSMAPIPPLRPGAMVRKGSAGAAREDGMTAEISEELRTLGSQICPDAQALRWLYEGGSIGGERVG